MYRVFRKKIIDILLICFVMLDLITTYLGVYVLHLAELNPTVRQFLSLGYPQGYIYYAFTYMSIAVFFLALKHCKARALIRSIFEVAVFAWLIMLAASVIVNINFMLTYYPGGGLNAVS